MDIIARILRNESPPEAPEERCDYCARPIGEAHPHLVDLTDRRLMCACRPCYLVFAPSGAAKGRYKVVPERYVHLKDLTLSDATWDQLQIPIGLAFFFYNSAESKMMAFYPGPAGAMESLLSLDMWNNVLALEPQLSGMESDVEALLVRRQRENPQEYFIVPIDACYQLIGLIRLSWKGFDGGEEARERIDGFFGDLRTRSGRAPTGVTRT